MPWVLVVFAVISGASFAFYGYETLCAERLRGEFERFGVPGLRRFVGATQFLGGTGVLIGLWFAPVGAAAAAGLTAMMALGLVVRFRIHDAPRLMVPAASLGSINAALVALFLLA